MKITYSNRANETITRDVAIGQKLVGIRVETVLIQTHEEMQTLLSERGLEWAKRNLIFRPTFALLKQDSNWGSDWVDDGV